MPLYSKEVKQELKELLDANQLAHSAVCPLPILFPVACFPEPIARLLEILFPEKWSLLPERSQNYLKWITVKAESIDALLSSKNTSVSTKGFELLAIDHNGCSFGEILQRCETMKIPCVLVRFASLVATLLTIRLLRLHIEQRGDPFPPLMFTQNVDTSYLNYPHALHVLLDLFPEHNNHFYFEVSETLTRDYLSTVRALSEDLSIRLVLDDTNQMDAFVHQELLDFADWIKIDFRATAGLEKLLQDDQGDQILWHYEYYNQHSQSLAIVFEGLGEDSPLKTFLQNNWKHPQTPLYYQSRERLPIPPWDKYFGLIQDYIPENYGLFFKGLLQDDSSCQ